MYKDGVFHNLTLPGYGQIVMNFEEALKLIDDLVFIKEGRHLKPDEITVIEAAWEDKGYKQIAENSPYRADDLHHHVGPKLWKLLSTILGNGEKVTKKRLRSILEQRTTKPDPPFLSGISSQSNPNNTFPYVIGGQPPYISSFYGRVTELTKLRELIIENRCVTIVGAAGIGKSALAAKLIQDISANSKYKFDCFVWKSVYYAPPLESLVTDLLRHLAPTSETEPELPVYTQAKVSVLLKHLQSRRCLVVLDAAEAVLKGDRNNSFNPYGEQHAEYGIFLRRIVEELQHSCLVLTSREPFNDLDRLQLAGRPYYSFKLEGLDLESAMQILRRKGLTGEGGWEKLIQTYLGNPLALELTATRIKDFFGGNVENFFECQTSLMSDFFQEALQELFGAEGRLTNLEKRVVIYLAESLSSENADELEFTKLLSGLKASLDTATSEIIRALEALGERALIERSQSNTGESLFSLQPVVKKYVLVNLSKITRSAA